MNNAPTKRCTVRLFSGPIFLCLLGGQLSYLITTPNEHIYAILRQEDEWIVYGP